MGILEEWPKRFVPVRRYCGMPRGECLVSRGMCGSEAQNTGLTVRCGILPPCSESWTHEREYLPGERMASGTSRSVLVSWSHIPQRRMTEHHRHFPKEGLCSTFLVSPFLTSILCVCRYDAVPPSPKRQMPLGSQEQCLFVTFWAGWRVSLEFMGSLDKEGTGVSGTSVSPPSKVLSSLTPLHPKQNPSYTGGTKPATEKLSGFLWCLECSIKNQCQ